MVKHAVWLAALVPALAVGGAEAGQMRAQGRGRPQVRTYRLPNGRVVQKYVTPGTQSDPVSDYGLGVSGTITAAGARVTGVDAGGPAERVGIESGDTILTVNGTPITGAPSWAQAMSGQSFVRLRLKNVRGGPTVYRDVDLTNQGGVPTDPGSGTPIEPSGGTPVDPNGGAPTDPNGYPPVDPDSPPLG